MKITRHESELIHIVMEMAYEQGVEEGRKQAMLAMTELKAEKEKAHKERMDRDFSHHPSKNIYGG